MGLIKFDSRQHDVRLRHPRQPAVHRTTHLGIPARYSQHENPQESLTAGWPGFTQPPYPAELMIRLPIGSSSFQYFFAMASLNDRRCTVWLIQTASPPSGGRTPHDELRQLALDRLEADPVAGPHALLRDGGAHDATDPRRLRARTAQRQARQFRASPKRWINVTAPPCESRSPVFSRTAAQMAQHRSGKYIQDITHELRVISHLVLQGKRHR
jgi:hypothetical protein